MKRRETSKVEAIWRLLDDVDIDSREIQTLYSTVSFNKIVCVLEYLKNDNQ